MRLPDGERLLHNHVDGSQDAHQGRAEGGARLSPSLSLRYNGSVSLSREEVLHVSQLARIGLSDAEIDSMREQLNHIIDQFAVLQELDTDTIPPTAQVFVASNTLREDVVGEPAPVEKILLNAPRADGEYFRVRAVLEE